MIKISGVSLFLSPLAFNRRLSFFFLNNACLPDENRKSNVNSPNFPKLHDREEG